MVTNNSLRPATRRLGALSAVLIVGVLAGAGLVGTASPAAASPPTAFDGVRDPRSTIGGGIIGEIDVEVCGDSLVAVARGLDEGVWFTSISADDVTRAQWAPWRLMPSRTIAPPVLAPTGSECFVFAVGTNHQLFSTVLFAPGGGSGIGWTGVWTARTGLLAEQPTILPGPNGSFEMVARGMDTAIWIQVFDDGLSGWAPVHGHTLYRPSISIAAGGNECIAAVGLDRQLYEICTTASGPTGWISHGGQFSGAPTAAPLLNASGAIVGRVYAGRGMDEAVWVNARGFYESLGGRAQVDAPDLSQFRMRTGPVTPLQVGALGLDGRDWTRTTTYGLFPWTAWARFTMLSLQGPAPLSSPGQLRAARTTETSIGGPGEGRAGIGRIASLLTN